MHTIVLLGILALPAEVAGAQMPPETAIAIVPQPMKIAEPRWSEAEPR